MYFFSLSVCWLFFIKLMMIFFFCEALFHLHLHLCVHWTQTWIWNYVHEQRRKKQQQPKIDSYLALFRMNNNNNNKNNQNESQFLSIMIICVGRLSYNESPWCVLFFLIICTTKHLYLNSIHAFRCNGNGTLQNEKQCLSKQWIT